MPAAPTPSVSVVVATYSRPDHVRTCLQHLATQTVKPFETVVVDSSPDDRTQVVVADFPDVRYLRNERGAGTLATSRAIGFGATTGDVVAYVDDDAFAAPDWLEQLLVPYQDADVAAVGGRARNGRPGEEQEGLDEIGLLLRDGRLTGNFAADPGRLVDTDHMLGANMSYRRSVAEGLGGVRDHYPGTCLREDADMPLRMRRAGYRVVYAPAAVVDHVAAPYPRGRRFDLRYTYYAQRNHVVLLSRTLGGSTPHLRRYWASALREVGKDLAGAGSLLREPRDGDRRKQVRAVGGTAARAAVKLAGLAAGGVAAVRLRALDGPPNSEVAGPRTPSSTSAPERRRPLESQR